VRKIIYFVIFLALLITFFFGPIGRVDTNVDITNNSPTTNQQNEPPIIPLMDKDSSNEKKNKIPIENNKQENNNYNNSCVDKHIIIFIFCQRVIPIILFKASIYDGNTIVKYHHSYSK
jgi:hypothetical protein